MHYELFYLVGQNQESKLEEIKKEVEKILTDEGAIFEELEVINKRKLSYEIKHQIRGIYIARRFKISNEQRENSEGQMVSRLEIITKKLNLNSNVLRFLIVKADELPELKIKEEKISTPVKKEYSKEKSIEKKTFSSSKNNLPKKENEENIDKKLEEILNI